MRVLVTGATGFIGRRLVNRLLFDDWSVSALVRQPVDDLPNRVRQINATLETPTARLSDAIFGHDCLFHLAACVSFDTRRLPELIRINAEGTRNILQAASDAGISRVVIASSACTIGLSQEPNHILAEDSPPDPSLGSRNPYLASKLLAEAYAVEAAQRGQQVIIVNPTTVFGPGDRTLNSGTLIRQVAMSRVLPVPSGGSNVVDVDDVVDGLLAAAERGESGRRYILGGHNLTFREIIEQSAAAVGRRPLLVPMNAAARGPMIAAAWLVGRFTGSRLITPQIIADTFAYKYYSSRRAASELGWRASRPFTETLRRAWAYYREAGLIPAPQEAAA